MDVMSGNTSMVFASELWLVLVGVKWLQRRHRFGSYMPDA